MHIRNLKNRADTGYTTFGSVWNRGECRSAGFALFDSEGSPVPVQSRVTAYWPDGSVKWAAHTADASLLNGRGLLEQNKASVVSQACITIEKQNGMYEVSTGLLSLSIPASGSAYELASHVRLGGVSLAERIYPVFRLERRTENENSTQINDSQHFGVIDEVALEEEGPLCCTFRFSGKHIAESGNDCTMPFVIRMELFAGSAELRFAHTFFYDGQEERDRLKGMGLRADMLLSGEKYTRHIKLGTDKGIHLHEAAVLLNCNYPRLPDSFLQAQMDGSVKSYAESKDVTEAAEALPVWNRYTICQDSASHYSIRKQTQPGCCRIDCLNGERAPGAMSVHSAHGGLMIGLRDFWCKYPSGLEADGLGGDMASCTVWFYSPDAESYDFRHYDTRSYMMSSYEGYEYTNACACGIAVTSHCRMLFTADVPSDEQMDVFLTEIQKPPVFIAAPEYYHDKAAFGYWSLPSKNTEVEAFLEGQLSDIVDFYINEVKNRSWYGLFDYGDVMHTYDPIRHCWRYDMGGFAWQNTELVPTYWLWLYFLRTGREDVFTLAEAMTRHCSDVDFYHFGPIKGIGTRHNVRHWGCSCKEPRVSMAGHHRVLYYLTGDRRIGDAMDDVKDADKSLKNVSSDLHERQGSGKARVFVRSGPDWSSFVSNWMTRYERTLEPYYRSKIEKGISDIYAAPFGLTSGPEFEYFEDDGHLVYQGEDEKTPNMHLQVCMGGPEVWMETADALENETLKALLIDHGKRYYMSSQERSDSTDGRVSKRTFGFPYFAADLAAYSAWKTNDCDLARRVWSELLGALISRDCTNGFSPQAYAKTANDTVLTEIPWLKTNFAAQWCLKVIVVLELLRDHLPDTMEKALECSREAKGENWHKA